MLSFLSTIWSGIMAFFHAVGRVMTVILLTVMYVVIIVPLGLLLLVFRRPPLYRGQPTDTTWRPVAKGDMTLEDARSPF